MTTQANVALNVTPSLREYRSELSKMPGIMDKASKESGSKLEKNLGKSFKEVGKESEKASGGAKWKDTFKAIGAGGAVLGGLAVAWAGLNQKVADYRNELLDSSVKTGIAAETLNGLKLAAKASGQEFSNVEGGLIKIPKLMSDVAAGSKGAADKFKALGVEVQNSDGSLRDVNDVVGDVIGQIEGMNNPTERAAAATGLLGKSGAALNQALAAGDLDHFTEMANTYGTSVAPNAAKSSASWQRESALLQNTLRGVAGEIVDLGGNGGTALRFFNASIVFTTTLVKESVSLWLDTMGTFFGGFAKLVSGDWKGAAEDLTVGFRRLTDGSIPELVIGAKDAAQALLDDANALELTAGAARGAADAVGSFGAGLSDVTTKVKAQKEELLASTQTAEKWKRALDVSALGEPLVKYYEQLEAIDAAVAEKTLTEIQGTQASQLAEDELAQSLQEEHTRRMESFRKERIAREDAVAAVREKEKELAKEKNAAILATTQLSMASASQIAGALDQVFQMQMDNENLTRAEKRKLFNQAKAAAVLQAGINTALAITTAFAQLGPVGGGLATAGIVAMGAAQIAAISSKELPEFHTGGLIKAAGATPQRPGEVDIRAQEGEGVLTAQGVRAAGGPGGLDRLNAGGGYGRQILDLRIGRRKADSMTYDALTTGPRTRQVTRALKPSYRRNPYDR